MTRGGSPAAFGLVYLTFFLDNVLLTALVPIIPDLLEAPGTNSTLLDSGPGAGGAAAGAVLGAKAGAQLLAAGPAAALVLSRGPRRVLAAGTALLAVAAIILGACVSLPGGGAAAGWALGVGRAAQGAGAAGAGVAGLALAAAVAPSHSKERVLAALLGAVALGVLVGYPLGGAADAFWATAAPFQLVAAALFLDLALQHVLLTGEEFDKPQADLDLECRPPAAARGAAGAVFLATSAVAALEPLLPLMVDGHWLRAAVFLPDSLAYFIATGTLGGSRRPERLSLLGLAGVSAGALLLPALRGGAGRGAATALLGGGLGALDAALLPALLSRAPPRQVPPTAALLQAAASAAYAVGPALGGLVSWALGVDALLRLLGVANALYLGVLYAALRRHPLSQEWGAPSPPEVRPLTPLPSTGYTTLKEDED